MTSKLTSAAGFPAIAFSSSLMETTVRYQGITKLVSKAAVVAGAAICVALATPSAFAAPAGATLTASPSTGLHDGDTVTLSVAGFAGNADLVALECASPSAGVTVCDPTSQALLHTNAGGTASAPATVHRTFTGYLPNGTVWGSVDCTTAAGGCGFGVTNGDASQSATTTISFG
jgi:hypothetical protein